MRKTSLVVTAIGNDRPGLVQSLAHVVAEHNANWVESRMAHLGGQFAGILRVEVDSQREAALASALRQVGKSDLDLVIHADPTPPEEPAQDFLRLNLVGLDHPGIVSEITRVLSRLDVNVEELSTECREAPTTGQTLFHATASLRLPADLSEHTLRDELERIAGDLMVDLTLGTAGDHSGAVVFNERHCAAFK
jgi:glycine cleavage system regulatory protein